MELCVVSFKQCWQEPDGRWCSYGGFPAQMHALASIVDALTLVVVRAAPRAGGMPLPPQARVVPLRSPVGVDGRRKLSVAAHLPYYLRIIGREVRRADAVHTPVPGDIAFLGMAVATLLGRPLFALYNGSWVPNSQTTVMNRVTRTWMRSFAGNARLMLAVGDGVGPPARGMDWLFATSLSRAELAAAAARLERGLARPPRLIYAGRLSAEKGVPHLLHALAALRAEGFEPLPRLTLAGDGPERPALEALVRALDCGELVRFAGQLARDALGRELAAADLCVHPSLTEGFCKAWLDAMAFGLPVLTTAVGAAEAVVGAAGERGWLVAPGRPEALAAGIRRVLTAPVDWPSLRRRCRAYAEAHTLEDWAERIARSCARQWGTPLRARAPLQPAEPVGPPA